MLWLGTSRGLYRFDPSSGLIIGYRHDPNNPFSLSSNEIRTTGEDREGDILGWHQRRAGCVRSGNGEGHPPRSVAEPLRDVVL
jgi:hypothetical protein